MDRHGHGYARSCAHPARNLTDMTKGTAMTFQEAVGVDVRVDGDVAVVTLVAGERHLNGHGSVHGGVIATLADIAMGAVLNAHTPADAGPVTVSLVTTYLE